MFEKEIQLVEASISVVKSSIYLAKLSGAEQQEIELIEKMAFHMEAQRDCLVGLARMVERKNNNNLVDRVYTVPVGLH